MSERPIPVAMPYESRFVDIGPGLHFVQEDRPHEIGEAIRAWHLGLDG